MEWIILIGFLLILLPLNSYLREKWKSEISLNKDKATRCDLLKQPHRWVYINDDSGMICEKCGLKPSNIIDSVAEY